MFINKKQGITRYITNYHTSLHTTKVTGHVPSRYKIFWFGFTFGLPLNFLSKPFSTLRRTLNRSNVLVRLTTDTGNYDHVSFCPAVELPISYTFICIFKYFVSLLKL